MCFLDEHPPSRGQGEGLLSASFRLISPLTQRACNFFGEGKLQTIAASWIHVIQPVPHVRAQPAMEASRSAVGWQRWTTLLPRTQLNVQPLL